MMPLGVIKGETSGMSSSNRVPLLNLGISAVFSAFIALLFDLEKLVEFMSIGTLLAYTIVSASIIILRYKSENPEQKLLKDEDDASVSTVSTQSDNSYKSPFGKLKPEFWWLSNIVSGCGGNEAISGTVIVLISCSIVISIHLNFTGQNIVHGDWWAILILMFLILCWLGCLLVIGAHRQNPVKGFRVPFVPIVPGLSILCNIALMVHLNVLTWIRFTVWMILGLLVYFLYGIKHSKEGQTNNTYSMLITSSEAHKESWGTMNPRDDSTESKMNEQAEGVHQVSKILGPGTSSSKKKGEKRFLTDNDDSD